MSHEPTRKTPATIEVSPRDTARGVVTFILGVALPVLSAGILVNEVLHVTLGQLVPMDAVLSPLTTRILGTSMVGLGLAVCVGTGLDRSTPRSDRRYYRLFILVNLVLAVAWTVFWVSGAGRPPA